MTSHGVIGETRLCLHSPSGLVCLFIYFSYAIFWLIALLHLPDSQEKSKETITKKGTVLQSGSKSHTRPQASGEGGVTVFILAGNITCSSVDMSYKKGAHYYPGGNIQDWSECDSCGWVCHLFLGLFFLPQQLEICLLNLLVAPSVTPLIRK